MYLPRKIIGILYLIVSGFANLKKVCYCIAVHHEQSSASYLSAKESNLSDILRDFEKFTSKQVKAVEENKQESRREWMLEIFRKEGAKNSRNNNYQFWRQDNQPQELYSPAFMFQKINYIHNNPVEAGITERPGHYI